MEINAFREKQLNFNSGDGKIKYLDQGTGPIILLVHGFPVSSWIYHRLIPILVQAGYRIIAPDLLGYGASDNPKSPQAFEVKEQAKNLIKLMNHLGIDKWVQLTHDFGGPVTWEMMRIQSESIKHLFILNTILLPQGFKPPFISSIKLVNRLISWLYSKRIFNKRLVTSLLKSTLYKEKASLDLKEGITKSWNEGKTEAIYHFLNFINAPFYALDQIFKSYSGKTTIIWGKHDKVLHWDSQKNQIIRILNINQSDIFLIEGNHYIQYENAEEVADIAIKRISQT